MAKKLLNGREVDMTVDEEAAFESMRSMSTPQAKKAMRDRLAARRIAAEHGGFAYLGLRYDSSDPALARLSLLGNRARTAKANSEAFSVSMTALDDSASNFSANEMIALEVAAGDHYVLCSANYKTLKQAVNGAADAAAALALDLDAGWP